MPGQLGFINFMAALTAFNPQAFIGSAWSLWIPGNAARGLNFVQGDRLTASLIISVLLMRPGEDPMHPALGIAPELFEPLSGYQPQYWVHNAREEILRWVGSLEELNIEINQFPDPENRLGAYIAFRSKGMSDRSILTFGWNEYVGASYDRGIQTFLDDVQLNGQRFKGF